MTKETNDPSGGTPMRRWQPVPKAHVVNSAGEPVRFTLMTYNILTPSLATQDQFPHSTPEALNRNSRRKRIVEKIAHYRPDIICLQEMDEQTEFRRFFQHRLAQLNYKCHFRPPRGKSHGCCLAWNQDDWYLVDSVPIPLNRQTRVQGLLDWYLETTGKSLDGLAITPDRRATAQQLCKPWRSNRVNSAALLILHRLSPLEQRWCARRADEARQRRQIGALMDMFQGMTIDGPHTLDEQNDPASPTDELLGSEPNLDDNDIIVVTCHLHWHPEAQFERLLQTLSILRQVQIYNADTCYPVLFAGDFNTIPLDPLYKALVNQPLNARDVDKLVGSMELYAAMQLNARGSIPFQLSLPIDYIPDEAKRDYVQGFFDQITSLGPFTSAYDQPELHPPVCSTSLPACCEPPYTTYCEFVNTLDYIFYSARPLRGWALPRPRGDCPAKFKLLTPIRTHGQDHANAEADVATWWSQCRVRRILEIPPRSVLEPGIPSAHFPSDHLCLLAEMEVSRPLLPEQHAVAVCVSMAKIPKPLPVTTGNK
ncbi:RNA exonuclease ngl2 [Dimargaris xerosporica]|nr:RNA exonuclease ngl2 [Dimargaris xerosporica]